MSLRVKVINVYYYVVKQCKIIIFNPPTPPTQGQTQTHTQMDFLYLLVPLSHFC